MRIRYHQLIFVALVFLVGLYGKVVGATNSLPLDSHAHHKKFRILSIDGGGLLGIIPARILQEIEKQTADSEWSESAMSTLYQHSYRLQVSIPKALSSMDVSRNLDKLESLAEAYINNSSSFKCLCTDLMQWSHQGTE